MAASDLVVLFGGTSGERRVSVASAQNIALALGGPPCWFIDLDERVTVCTADAVRAHDRPFELEFRPPAAPQFPTIVAALGSAEARGKVFVLALHGGVGEDGTIQRLLETRGLAYTGSGPKASAAAFDKAVAKELAKRAGVAIADAVMLPRDELPSLRVIEEMRARHGRAVVKPVADGSSVGLHHVTDAASAQLAARDAAASDKSFLCEAYVSGVELTIGVVDGQGGPRALPPSEVRVDPGRAFDYEGKYLGKGTTEITPAEVPPEIARAAQQTAITAHVALGCQGYSRTDLIVGPRGPVFLELNTLPGLTRASFIPQQLAVEGTSLPDFLAGQIALAIARRDLPPALVG